jgi:flagellar biosynthesis protein FliQ
VKVCHLSALPEGLIKALLQIQNISSDLRPKIINCWMKSLIFENFMDITHPKKMHFSYSLLSLGTTGKKIVVHEYIFYLLSYTRN